jgi:predicted DNA-binding transcriptional regulator YafY
MGARCAVIALLEEMGIPITAERGRYGGYSLVAGFKLRR